MVQRKSVPGSVREQPFVEQREAFFDAARKPGSQHLRQQMFEPVAEDDVDAQRVALFVGDAFGIAAAGYDHGGRMFAAQAPQQFAALAVRHGRDRASDYHRDVGPFVAADRACLLKRRGQGFALVLVGAAALDDNGIGFALEACFSVHL